MEIRYPATIEPQDDGSFLVRFVDLPDTYTEGKTKEEAIFNAGEVLSGMLAWRLDEAKKVPAPSLNSKARTTSCQMLKHSPRCCFVWHVVSAACPSWLVRW